MLTTESLKKIDREIAKYPTGRQQSAVMAALVIAQEEKGGLSSEIIAFIAALLGMPPIAVYEVASFYGMYVVAPAGKHRLVLCTNLPCQLSGAEEAAAYLKKKLGIGFNETTPDGRFTLEAGECMGACGDAPVMLMDQRRLCCRMSPEEIDQLLRELD